MNQIVVGKEEFYIIISFIIILSLLNFLILFFILRILNEIKNQNIPKKAKKHLLDLDIKSSPQKYEFEKMYDNYMSAYIEANKDIITKPEILKQFIDSEYKVREAIKKEVKNSTFFDKLKNNKLVEKFVDLILSKINGIVKSLI